MYIPYLTSSKKAVSVVSAARQRSSKSFLQDILDCLLETVCYDVDDDATQDATEQNHKKFSVRQKQQPQHLPQQHQQPPDVVPLRWFSSSEVQLTHRKNCWPVESDQTSCLNGGQCFAVEFHDGFRRAGCSCPSNWIGDRCEQRYIDPNRWSIQHHMKTAGTAPPTTILVICASVFLLVLYTHLRRSKVTAKDDSSSTDTCRKHIQDLTNYEQTIDNPNHTTGNAQMAGFPDEVGERSTRQPFLLLLPLSVFRNELPKLPPSKDTRKLRLPRSPGKKESFIETV